MSTFPNATLIDADQSSWPVRAESHNNHDSVIRAVDNSFIVNFLQTVFIVGMYVMKRNFYG